MHAHQLAQTCVPDGKLSEKEDGQYHSDRLSLQTAISVHDLVPRLAYNVPSTDQG